MTIDRGIEKIYTRVLTPRVLMLVFTLEISAVTNLMTSLVGETERPKIVVVLLASLFYFVAGAYALATDGLLHDLDLITKNDYERYKKEIREHAGDLAWWLAAHVACALYGTALLLPR